MLNVESRCESLCNTQPNNPSQKGYIGINMYQTQVWWHKYRHPLLSMACLDCGQSHGPGEYIYGGIIHNKQCSSHYSDMPVPTTRPAAMRASLYIVLPIRQTPRLCLHDSTDTLKKKTTQLIDSVVQRKINITALYFP